MTQAPTDDRAPELRAQVRDCIGETIPLRRRWVNAIMAGPIAGILAENATLRRQVAEAQAMRDRALDAAERAVRIADGLGSILATAEARAREAEARAERYAALLHPLAVYAAVALPPEGLDGEIGEVIVGAFRRSIRTTDLRAILLEFPQPEESADARF